MNLKRINRWMRMQVSLSELQEKDLTIDQN